MRCQLFICGLLASLLLTAGCSTRVHDVATDPAFTAAIAENPALALGGVVTGPTLEMRLAADDAEDADAALYRAFLTKRPDLTVITTAAVDGRLDRDHLAGLREEYARLGRLRRDQLATVAEVLPEVRFLVLARLTSDRTRTITPEDRGIDPDRAGAEGVPEDTEDWSSLVLTEREIGVTLQFFDVRTGRIAWEAEATTRERQHYAYEDVLAEDAVSYVRDRLADREDVPTVPRDGVFLRVPDLVEMLETALVELVDRLPADGS